MYLSDTLYVESDILYAALTYSYFLLYIAFYSDASYVDLIHYISLWSIMPSHINFLFSTDGETDLNAPVWLAMLLITIFLTFDAVVFMFMESWSFGNSLYFIFITLTTIGFGDIVPINSEVCLLFVSYYALYFVISLFIHSITHSFMIVRGVEI